MWESWNAVKPDGSKDSCSFNHYAFGCVGNWIYRNILGIQCAVAGYSKVIIAPDLNCGLTWVKGHYNSVNGKIAVEWRKEKDNVSAHVEIPVNTTAVVRLGRMEEITVGSGIYDWKIQSL